MQLKAAYWSTSLLLRISMEHPDTEAVLEATEEANKAYFHVAQWSWTYFLLWL